MKLLIIIICVTKLDRIRSGSNVGSESFLLRLWVLIPSYGLLDCTKTKCIFDKPNLATTEFRPSSNSGNT